MVVREAGGVSSRNAYGHIFIPQIGVLLVKWLTLPRAARFSCLYRLSSAFAMDQQQLFEVYLNKKTIIVKVNIDRLTVNKVF